MSPRSIRRVLGTGKIEELINGVDTNRTHFFFFAPLGGVELFFHRLEGLVGATFAVEPDPIKAAELLDTRIGDKREALGLAR